jgi:hypothetical protein
MLHWVRWGALGASLALVPTACGIFVGDELRPLTLTEDDGDAYRWTDEGDGVIEVVPADGNQGSNLRQVLPDTNEVSQDQESCATWEGPIDEHAQPGVALRIAEDDGRVRAITVSNNVWSAARYHWNVHLADSSAERPMTPGGRGVVPDFASDLADLSPLPWRMCARVDGNQLIAKIWSVEERDSEPDWDDPDNTFRLQVPSEWVYEGKPGVYLGHLSPDERSTFSDIETVER